MDRISEIYSASKRYHFMHENSKEAVAKAPLLTKERLGVVVFTHIASAASRETLQEIKNQLRRKAIPVSACAASYGCARLVKSQQA